MSQYIPPKTEKRVVKVSFKAGQAVGYENIDLTNVETLEAPTYIMANTQLVVYGHTTIPDGTIVRATAYSPAADTVVTCSRKLSPNSSSVETIAKACLFTKPEPLWKHQTVSELNKEMASLLFVQGHENTIKLALKDLPLTEFDIVKGLKWTALVPKDMSKEEKLPVLIAHTDLSAGVKHPTPENLIYDADKGCFNSPTGLGADDRAGVFAIRQLLKHNAGNFIAVFTDEEEIGCVGARDFVKGESFKKISQNASCFISIDRKRGANGEAQVATYGYSSSELEKVILDMTGRPAVRGSMTDCKVFSEATGTLKDKNTVGTACVNFSCGYIYEHSSKETLYFNELLETVKDLEILLDNGSLEGTTFTYDNAPFSYGGAHYGHYNTDYYKAPKSTKSSKSTTKSVTKSQDLLDFDCIFVGTTAYSVDDVENLLDFYLIHAGKQFKPDTVVWVPLIGSRVTMNPRITSGCYAGADRISPTIYEALASQDFMVTEVNNVTSKVTLLGLSNKTRLTNVPIAAIKKASANAIAIQ